MRWNVYAFLQSCSPGFLKNFLGVIRFLSCCYPQQKNLIGALFYTKDEIHNAVYYDGECSRYGNFTVDYEGPLVDKAQNLYYQILVFGFIPQFTALIVIG